MPRPEKAAAVTEIAERFGSADAALLTEYRGLKVGEMAEVRQALREQNADYKVLKNTLARIAVREAGLEDLADMLVGPTAIAFVAGDPAGAAKALDEAAKKYPVLVIKGGVLLGKILTPEQAALLAKLEPREVQLAKIAMMVNSPAQQAVNVLSALLRNFGSMVAQVLQKKESGELPGGAAPEAEAAPAEPEAEAVPAEPEAEPAPEAEAAPAEPEAEAEAPAPEAAAGADESPQATQETEGDATEAEEE